MTAPQQSSPHHSADNELSDQNQQQSQPIFASPEDSDKMDVDSPEGQVKPDYLRHKRQSLLAETGRTGSLPDLKKYQTLLEEESQEKQQASGAGSLLHNHIMARTNTNATLSRSSSTKSLSFKMDEVTLIPAHPKTKYDRKPDADITFRKLTPQLKMEIREELNMFKQNEMQVHEESLQNTAFH